MTAILLLAALLRFGWLGNIPPGLAHDEVANWLIAREILNGEHAIYFTAAYGHEPLYQYLQAATVALFGNQWLGLRYPSAALGLLGLATTYTLIRRLFDSPTALLTAGWLAVSFWPVFYSRVALRAISLPVIAALFAYFLTRALVQRKQTVHRRGNTNWHDWLIAGFFLGASLYTYMAGRILPFITLAISTYLLVFSRAARRQWSGILVMWATAAIVSAPLILWLLGHPGAEYRITEIQEPLTRLLAGDPSLVWKNFIANLRFFTISGDPWPRQNVPGRPVFADVLSAMLFYAGIALALWHWREPCYGTLLIWLLGSLGPSVATADPPSSIRDILALVVVFVFPAQAQVRVGHWLKQSPLTRSRRWLNCALWTMAILPVAITGLSTGRDYFLRWPRNDVVRFDYQSDLTAVARRLDDLPADTSVTVAGLSVHTMDSPSLKLSSRRDTRDVRLCDTRETLVIPTGPSTEIYVPNIVPLDDNLRQQILEWGAFEEHSSDSAYRRYHLASSTPLLATMIPNARSTVRLTDATEITLPVSFDGKLSLLGYRWVQAPSVDSQSATLLTYWQVESQPMNPLKVFSHLLQVPETFIAQDDGLASPSSTWAPGDIIIQKHLFSLPDTDNPALLYTEVGVYDSATGIRLMAGAYDRLLLPTLGTTR